MEKYKNLQGVSAVRAFRIGIDFIEVMFDDRGLYTYTNFSAGGANIEHMKKLARQGYGLNSFINKAVRKHYSKKSLFFGEISL